MLGIFVAAFVFQNACASCVSGVQELWAYSKTDTTTFSDTFRGKYISSSKGSVCQWLVQSSNKDFRVKLWFSSFVLFPASGDKTADCLEIYDGKNSKAGLLDEICNGVQSKPEYYSRGRYLYVIYKRGGVKGTRQLTFRYKAENPDNKTELIRTAAIVGGSLAAVALLFLIIKHTECFSCFRKKGNNSTTTNANGNSMPLHDSSNNQERDRLTPIVVNDEGETIIGSTSSTSNQHSNSNNNATNNINNNNNSNDNYSLAPPSHSNGRNANHNRNRTTSNHIVIVHADDQMGSNNHLSVGASSSILEAGDSNNNSLQHLDVDAESDSGDSLPTQNEPPPSYESLYLNEDGIQPPEYSPPRHRSTNPPRRVHTFN